MKTKLIILFTLLLIICTGCEKHECAELSWTDYNTVEDVHCNFAYNMDEFRQYVGDTLKVYGWLFKSTEGYKRWQYLTSNKEVQFCENMSILFKYPTVNLDMQENYYQLMPEDPYNSMLYVTGTIWYFLECNEFCLTVTDIKSCNPQ